jgi:peptidyl-prolyl cis-trans isomerase B (cyclophilin B)
MGAGLSFAAMRRPLTLAVTLGLLLLLGSCGGDKEKTAGRKTEAKKPAATATQPPARTTPAAQPRCLRTAAPRPKPGLKLAKPDLKLDAKKSYEALMDTNCGQFSIALDVKRAPKTTASFVYMAREGLYDNTLFHRIVAGFVIQGGDPLGTGQGGPGYSVVEAPPSDLKYTKGVVAMAKTEIEDPGTSGSQFYVVTGPDAQLPPEYALVGKVVSGQDVVDHIAVQPTDQSNPDPSRQERPVAPVVLRRVTITEK